MHEAPPLVTVAVPTYNRADLLGRALECLARQDYPNIEVIVSDNATPGGAVAEVVAAFEGRIANLQFFVHDRNIGPMANFFSAMDRSSAKYFMWLADDDEISPNFVSSLVDILENDPAAVTAVAHWDLKLSPDSVEPMSAASFPQSSRSARLRRFIWKSDDAFYYALHRLDALRSASFGGYWWPNRGVLRNWAYVYLLDLVIAGKVVRHPDPSVKFINHEYTEKMYVSPGHPLVYLLKAFVRRINVHALYVQKVARRCGWPLAISLIPISFASLIAEAARNAAGITAAIGRKVKAGLASIWSTSKR